MLALLGTMMSSAGGNGGIAYPLDDYPTGNTAAFSVARRLRSGYTGPLINVRESGGGTTADIFADQFGNLDEAALLSHVGANDGTVVTIYDQSASGSFDATAPATANQATIVNAGTIVRGTTNSRPSLDFDSADPNFYEYSDPGITQLFHLFTVYETSSAASSQKTNSMRASGTDINYLMSVATTGNGRVSCFVRDGGSFRFATGNTDIPLDEVFVMEAAVHTSTTVLEVWLNGVSDDTAAISTGITYGATKPSTLGRDSNDASSPLSGKWQESLIYHADKTAERASIFANIASYYNVP